MNSEQETENKLPRYCDYFKTQLVEELALEKDFKNLHYGKVAVIGRFNSETDLFRLENVRVERMPKEYRLPTGVISILLLNFDDEKINLEPLGHGNFCIIRGEVVLCNIQKANSPTLTTRGIHEQLHKKHLNEVQQKQYLDDLHKTYKPAISVWYAQRIELAGELIQRKLELRMIVQTN